jgi:hypothetical protein
MNPNVELTQRPVVAMAVAVVTNTITDLNITADHRCRHPALGMIAEGVTGAAGVASAVVTGDLSMARYLARRPCVTNTSLLPNDRDDDAAATLASIDTWVDYAQSLTLLDADQSLRASTLYNQLSTFSLRLDLCFFCLTPCLSFYFHSY